MEKVWTCTEEYLEAWMRCLWLEQPMRLPEADLNYLVGKFYQAVKIFHQRGPTTNAAMWNGLTRYWWAWRFLTEEQQRVWMEHNPVMWEYWQTETACHIPAMEEAIKEGKVTASEIFRPERYVMDMYKVAMAFIGMPTQAQQVALIEKLKPEVDKCKLELAKAKLGLA
ncbi:hypothetical protein AVT69_gp295 [Pseudomonas phage PhiPA3]|uniref:Uncharacterized protein 297 n=1 Tax=Pseudomonas phage PhiPA3 TaxID=998086 RepID=F8SJD3_BPPA3|nr:hypothetical protein AVT69_gp295 [Pseudomonas phage PhiPA3]AEH03720.1 hypothetical protein [Pseudomonas phage PhiPA3]